MHTSRKNLLGAVAGVSVSRTFVVAGCPTIDLSREWRAASLFQHDNGCWADVDASSLAGCARYYI